MHRIDTPTAQIDKFGAGKNGFTNGDPSTGRRATELNSDMWDAVQEEIANAIEGTGIELDKSKHNQLYLAIQRAISAPGFVKSVNTIYPDAGGNVALTAKDVAALPIYPDALSVDLNTLGATSQAGVYFQPLDAGATTPNNYPIGKAGSLLITPSAYGCQQEYTEFTDGRKFVRGLTAMWNGRNGPWSQWREYFGDGRKPTAQDVNALPITGGTLTGNLNVDGTDFINKRKYVEYSDAGTLHRVTNALHTLGLGDQYADLLFDEVVGQYAAFRIRVHSGGSDGWYEFRNDGAFNVSGTVGAGGSNGSKLHPDGNIFGTIWGGYLKDWLNNSIANAQNNAQNWAYQNLQQDTRFGERGVQTQDGTMQEVPYGCVVTGGNGNEGTQIGQVYYRPLQKLRNGVWVIVDRV